MAGFGGVSPTPVSSPYSDRNNTPGPAPLYGRLIAVCFIDGKDLNAMMVSGGWALAYRDYSEKYVPQENAAREASKGIWAMRFVPPWEWRRKELE